MPTQKELNDKYGNNLSVTSNDPAILQRDQSGNISPELSKTVYIEPINWAYDNNSINKIIDTRFSYYKFPPRLILDDTDVPDDVNIVDIGVSFDSRYKAEPQFIPTIDLLILDSFKINYGWNETPPAFTKPNDSTIAAAFKYYRAQLQAGVETKSGESLGRYLTTGIGILGIGGSFTTSSLFEGHFRKIKFTEIIDGLPQTQPGSFMVTQDLIDSKKSLEFNIQVAVSHPDNHGRNTFAIRLIRNRSNSSVDAPYQILKMVSSIDQGASANVDKAAAIEALAARTTELGIVQQALLKTQTQLDTAKLDLLTKQQKVVETRQIYNNQLALYVSAPKVYYKSFEQARDSFLLARKQLQNNQSNINGLQVTVNNLQSKFVDYNIAYQAALSLNSIDPSSPEAVLNSQYTYLWAGKTYFNLNYTLKSSDMKLNDIYSIEMLASKPQEYAHELIEENTYWDIKEISNSKVYSIETEASKWTASGTYDVTQTLKDVTTNGNFIDNNSTFIPNGNTNTQVN